MAKPTNDVCVSAFALAIVLALGLSGFLLATQWQSPPQIAFILNETINPNTASVASLLRLPGIGPARAQAIVTYREASVAEYPGRQPFQGLDDVTRVKGLGPRTVDALRPWLAFDDAK